jgi:tetratricopeptide (TPR) repeat protein
MLGHAANFRMQNDDDFYASQQALRYRLLAGESPSVTRVEWPLILGPRPADEAMLILDELDARRPSRDRDLPRAALLAMLGRVDEAWPLAEERSSHLREVTGNAVQEGHMYLWLIAMIDGDRERACRHTTDMLDVMGGDVSVSAVFWSFLARDLCYLGRVEEAELWLRRAQAVPPRVSVRVMAPSAEALLLAGRGEFEHAEALARTAVARAETETDNVLFQAWTNEDLANVLERAGRRDDACEPLERARHHWERKRCVTCANRVRERIGSLEPQGTAADATH